MATKFFCDRCHEEILSESRIRKVSLPEVSHYTTNRYEVDLCGNCHTDLDVWMHHTPTELREIWKARLIPLPSTDLNDHLAEVAVEQVKDEDIPL